MMRGLPVNRITSASMACLIKRPASFVIHGIACVRPGATYATRIFLRCCADASSQLNAKLPRITRMAASRLSLLVLFIYATSTAMVILRYCEIVSFPKPETILLSLDVLDRFRAGDVPGDRTAHQTGAARVVVVEEPAGQLPYRPQPGN